MHQFPITGVIDQDPCTNPSNQLCAICRSTAPKERKTGEKLHATVVIAIQSTLASSIHATLPAATCRGCCGFLETGGLSLAEKMKSCEVCTAVEAVIFTISPVAACNHQ